MAIERPRSVGMETDDGDLFVFRLDTEPSHSVLRSCMETLLNVSERGDGMILVGTLRPIKHGHQPSGSLVPQLRGIRIYRCRLPERWADVPPDTVPHRAVEHGWFPCVREGADVRLCFTLHGGGALAPALIPPLPSVGYRLWRKGQNTFAIAPKMLVTPSGDWDGLVKDFLQGHSMHAESEDAAE